MIPTCLNLFKKIRYDRAKKQAATVVDTDAIKASCKESWNLGNKSGIPWDFLQLSKTQPAKMRGLGEEEALKREYTGLKYW